MVVWVMGVWVIEVRDYKCYGLLIKACGGLILRVSYIVLECLCFKGYKVSGWDNG
jgi:hypothetical protein